MILKVKCVRKWKSWGFQAPENSQESGQSLFVFEFEASICIQIPKISINYTPSIYFMKRREKPVNHSKIGVYYDSEIVIGACIVEYNFNK